MSSATAISIAFTHRCVVPSADGTSTLARERAGATLEARRALARYLDDPLNRLYRYPVARAMAQPFATSRLRPDHVTYLHALVGVAASALVAQGSYGALVGAVALLELRSILDCFDGVLARVQQSSSPRGRTLDELGDAVSFIALCIGMALHVHRVDPTFPLGRLIGFYTALVATGALVGHAYDFYKRRIGSALKDGRDGIAGEMEQKLALMREGRGTAITRFGIFFDRWQVRLYEPRYDAGDRVAMLIGRADTPSLRRAVKLVGLLSWDNGLGIIHVGLLLGHVWYASIAGMLYGLSMWLISLGLVRRALGGNGPLSPRGNA